MPLPDYYVALLWAKLMGPKALSATATAGGGDQPLPAESSAIRIYAHCTTKTSGNSVTVLAINLDNSSTMLSFNNSLLGADDRTRPPLLPVEEYVLTPSEDVGSSLSGVAGLMGTVLFHLIGIFWMPEDIFTTERGEIVKRYRDFEIEREPPEEEEPEQSYTQTNPDAPENEPDEADTFAARSQQAAQEELPEEIDPENRPSSESDDDIETNQFITGDLSPPEFSPPPAPLSQESEENEPSEPQPLTSPITPTQPLAKQIPIPGEQEERDPDETGLAEVDHDETDAPTNVNEYIQGEAEEGEEDATKKDRTLC